MRFSGFSRARTLLPGAGNGTSARSATGEADVLSQHRLDAAASAISQRSDVDVVAVRSIPARSGAFGRWPDHLDPRLLAALSDAGIERPFEHQEIALRRIRDGADVVISTSTASGKSLCFHAPIVDAALRDPSARALMLFPTKALGRDQVEAMRQLTHRLGVGVGIYDGDTPPDERRAARTRAHAIATNPDMLHRGVLPHHEAWASFLAGLRYVVLDELHVYRGVFGSHVANVLRRLWRICGHYRRSGPPPQVIACSATIANPGELARALCSRPDVEEISANTAPAGPRTVLVVNPRVVDETTGVRRDYLKVTRGVASELQRAGVQTLAFCRTRKAVELLTRYLRDDARRERAAVGCDTSSEPPIEHQAIRGYRGGYLPDRRREVERALREGRAQIVATTNALELGIDIGGVDAVLISGYPGTRAATMQRIGRAGRRGRPSLAVLCLSSTPLDQCLATDVEVLFGQPPEHARIDPDNPEIVLPHLRCAAHELPFSEGCSMAGLQSPDLVAGLDYLAQRGALHRDVDEAGQVCWVGVGAASPAEQVELRGPAQENFSVVDPAGDILAEVAFEDAPLVLHPGAIYAVEAQTYEVRSLDWDARKAYVRPVRADYYTEAISNTRVRVVDPSECERATESVGTGTAHVVRTVPGFKKIRFDTHENIGFGPIELPDLELHTTAAFWSLPTGWLARQVDPATRAAATLGAAHALHHIAAMVLMCDVSDLGVVVTAMHPGAWGSVLTARAPSTETLLAAGATPVIVLYDRVAGGAGLATGAFGLGGELFTRAAALVRGCRCTGGCPTCLGAAADLAWANADRGAVVEALESFAKAAAS
jgi:DEAD/DEAH box helicase domain-containing protein